MVKENKLNGLVLVDKEKMGQILDEFKASTETKKQKWHRCNICDDPYKETELTDDEEVGYICEDCAIAKKELDDEQEEIETTMREEKKSKALP